MQSGYINWLCVRRMRLKQGRHDEAAPAWERVRPLTGLVLLDCAGFWLVALANSGMVSKRILVVDDVAIVSQATALMLESLGYSVDQAASGAEAIEQFKTAEYAAIIMDFNMPNMNGFECAAKIRELENGSGSRVPIICMSAAKDGSMKEQCLAAGLDDFLEKDCSVGELMATLLHWVG